jgi:peptidoglycan/LPS O-acetylase OafA/YrhL
MSLSAPRIPSLDGLRFLAITSVLIGHVVTNTLIGNLAHLGVCGFFVISGYLITSLLVTEYRKYHSIALGKFYLRRGFRIFPAALAYMGVIVTLHYCGYLALAPHDLVHSLTYTMNYHDSNVRSWYVGHLWSLSIEEQFYFLWPAIIAIFGVAGGLRGALGAVLLCPVLRIAAALLAPGEIHMIGEGFQYAMDALATGCVLAVGRQWLHQQPGYLSALRSPLIFVVVVIGAVADQLPSAKLAWLVGETVRNLSIAILLDRAITIRTGRFYQAMNWSPLVWVGQLSYSLYLWQQPFLHLHGTLAVNALPLNLACTFAAAIASFYLVEKPALRLRAHWFPDA